MVQPASQIVLEDLLVNALLDILVNVVKIVRNLKFFSIACFVPSAFIR
jgi:hypothetical protein